jgi:hypothetical protein
MSIAQPSNSNHVQRVATFHAEGNELPFQDKFHHLHASPTRLRLSLLR